LERHTEEADWTGGFVARFLTFYGEPERHFITPPMDDLQAKHSLAEWLRGLADFSVPMQSGEQANPPGMCKGMTPAAQQMWADWAAEEGKKTKGANTRVAASIARATSHAGKVAILLSWDIGRARSGETWHIGEAEVKSALAITSLHIKSVLELGERVTGSRDMRDRRAVLNAISSMAPTPLGVIIKRAALLKRRVVEVLDSLVEEQAVAVYTSSGRLSYLQSPEAQKLLLASDNIEEGAASLNIPRIVERHPAPRLTPSPVVPMNNIVRPGEVVWAKPDDWVEGEDH
jgi:K+-sensing histidine kinase KdpD